MRIKGHTRIDIVVVLLNPKARAVLNLVTTALSLLFCSLFTWLVWEDAWSALKGSQTSGTGPFEVPMFPVLIVLPLGGLLLVIQLIRDIQSNIRELKLPRGTQSNNPNVNTNYQEKEVT